MTSRGAPRLHAKPYNSASKRCNLCLSEKYVIIYVPHLCTLKKETNFTPTSHFVNAFLIFMQILQSIL